MQDAAPVEADRDRIVHVLGDELGIPAVGRDAPDLPADHVRVVEAAVRAELHRVAEGQPVGEDDRVTALREQLQQTAVHPHLVDEQPVPDAGDAVGHPHPVGDQRVRALGAAAPHPAGDQVGDVHRAVRTEGQVVR